MSFIGRIMRGKGSKSLTVYLMDGIEKEPDFPFKKLPCWVQVKLVDKTLIIEEAKK